MHIMHIVITGSPKRMDMGKSLTHSSMDFIRLVSVSSQLVKDIQHALEILEKSNVPDRRKHPRMAGVN